MRHVRLAVELDHRNDRLHAVHRHFGAARAVGDVGHDLQADPAPGVEQGMAQMSEKFRQMGNEAYVEAEAVKASNRVL